MSFWKKLKGLFGAKDEAEGKDIPVGDDEPCHFTITFRHSSKSIDFEGTWKQVRGLSGRFAGSKGLKMDNFYVPWDEVAFIYCGGRVADDEKEEKEGEKGLSGAKPGDEVPATDAAKALGAEAMEILPGDEAKEEKPEGKAEEAKAEGAKEEAAADATREEPLEGVKAEAATELDGISAEEIR